MQKLFFPIVFVIFSIACAHHWYTHRGTWVFENAKAEVFDQTNLIETAQSVSGGLEVTGTMAQSPASVAVSVGGNQLPSVSGSAIEVIQKVAQKEEIDWKILMALFIKETQGDCNREGDKDFIKPSWGCYQINKHYHPEVTWEQATDIEWSSYWTANRLKEKAAKYGWDNAIAMHNGNPKTPAVQEYLKDVKEIIKSL